METNSRELEVALLKRWKKKVRSDSELREAVRIRASRLLSGVQLFIEERQCRLVEGVVMDAALVSLATEKLVYVV